MFESDKLNELKAFRGLGQKFLWVGVEMFVVGFTGGVSFQPITLVANYVDKNGVLHIARFTHEELPLLISQNN